MSGWRKHEGLAVCLPLNNIDTDQLIPARFMSRPRVDGYGDFLFHDIRQNTNSQPDPKFVLNRHPQASVLITGQIFGSGSSREAAVYALVDAGIHVVIAHSFADIFAANAVNNGLLPACIKDTDLSLLNKMVGENILAASIDLAQSIICIAGLEVEFSIDSSSREKLINGWDDIDLTLKHQTLINDYSKHKYRHASWAWPTGEHIDG